jgi:hypothetical protein
LNPLPTVITHKDYIHAVFPTTYNKILLASSITHIAIHAHSPSTSFKMSAGQPSTTAVNTFAVKETSFPLSCVIINASDGGTWAYQSLQQVTML